MGGINPKSGTWGVKNEESAGEERRMGAKSGPGVGERLYSRLGRLDETGEGSLGRDAFLPRTVRGEKGSEGSCGGSQQAMTAAWANAARPRDFGWSIGLPLHLHRRLSLQLHGFSRVPTVRCKKLRSGGTAAVPCCRMSAGVAD